MFRYRCLFVCSLIFISHPIFPDATSQYSRLLASLGFAIGPTLTCTEPLVGLGNHSVIDKIVAKLSSLKRAGWLRRKIPAELAESVWEHTLKVVEAARRMAISRPQLQAEKLILMALIHDMAEADPGVGDITPHDRVEPAEKKRREWNAIEKLSMELAEFGETFKTVWLEFENGASPEALVVQQLDKIDAVIQSIYYERMGYEVSDFYPYAKARLQDPGLKKIVDDIFLNRANIANPYDQYFQLLEKLN